MAYPIGLDRFYKVRYNGYIRLGKVNEGYDPTPILVGVTLTIRVLFLINIL